MQEKGAAAPTALKPRELGSRALEQLRQAIRAVFDSWDSDRAKVYRRLNDIPGGWGTAVNVQAMVFGNMGETSATGVAFTRNPSTGESRLYGEFLINAQGEDVVAGIRNTDDLDKLGEHAQHQRLVDEMLRYVSPVQYFRRTATSDTELNVRVFGDADALKEEYEAIVKAGHELAHHGYTHTSPSRLSHMVRRLEDKGWVERTPATDDARGNVGRTNYDTDWWRPHWLAAGRPPGGRRRDAPS